MSFILLLDTGIDPGGYQNLQEFAEFINLSYQVIPVGLDYFRMLLKEIVMQRRLEQAQKKAEALANQDQARIAQYAMSFDLLSQLAQTMSEELVIKAVFELFSALFAPQKLTYLTVVNGAPEAAWSTPTITADYATAKGHPLAAIQEAYTYTPSGKGFTLQIKYQDACMGILEVEEIAFPEHLESYINMGISMVNVIGLAISNARKYKELLQVDEELRNAHRLAGISTLAAGMAHEINTPLQVITGSCHFLSRRLADDILEISEISNRLEIINRHAWKISEIVQAITLFTNPFAQHTSQHDFNTIITDAILLTQAQLSDAPNIQLSVELEEGIPLVLCDRDQIMQAVANLLTNAYDALISGGLVMIKSSYLQKEDQVVVTITDSGPGIPKEIQDRIFEPFVTTKDIGSGKGLGLSIAKGAVLAHKGNIQITNKENQGTTASFSLPVKPSSAAPQPDAPLIDMGRYTSSSRPN